MFRTPFGHFQYNVMPFGLTNAPVSFKRFINEVLRPFLDRFCTAYLDDILIYSNDLESYVDHVNQVLQALTDNDLYCPPEKCQFHVQEIKYLGLIITTKGLEMDPKKIKKIRDWKAPRNVKDIQGFTGFANFYRRFIKWYTEILLLITALTHDHTPFMWSPACQATFDHLKAAFTSYPVLRHFDPDRCIIVESDAFDYVYTGVLSQYNNSRKLHPVAYMNKKHSPAEYNYEIYDTELLAIIRCFEELRSELMSTMETIEVLSDHRNLE